MRLIDADALIPTQVHTVVVLKDGREQLESVLYAEQVDDAPTVEPASPWHRVEEPPKSACDCLMCWTTIHDDETGEVTGHGFWCEMGWYEDGLLGSVGFYCQSRHEETPVRVEPDYWMIIEPPKEEV